jgi:orotidine-5'-phosphate decarboxylase
VSDDKTARDRLIVALDHPTTKAALAQVDDLGDAVERYKVGLELYVAEGRALVDELHERDKRVFLDLKLHDIPETVRRAAEVASKMGVELLTVHAGGGRAMLEAAVAGAGATKILAVTVLTSLDAGDLTADGIAGGVEAAVLRRARLAEAAGCAGVIASPHEAAAIRAAVKPGFLVVTPGVRLADVSGEASGASRGSSGEGELEPAEGRVRGRTPSRMPGVADDQKRVATPRAAREAGADAVVVGRPIRDAQDRKAAAAAFLRELGQT